MPPSLFKSSCSGLRLGSSSGGVKFPSMSVDDKVCDMPNSMPIIWSETVPVTHHRRSTRNFPARDTSRVVGWPRI